ncbi:MAG: cell wall metabolism sensor histidine kinase WalK, partial [Chloroflexi bacterium]|nr:cell wall metabolism sensor histidine kinase WalK [Chloroflexota bacterium]
MGIGLSLRWKLVGSYLLIVVVVLISVVVLTRYAVQSLFLSYQEAVMARQALGVAHYVVTLYNATGNNWSRVSPIFKETTGLVRGTIWVADKTGSIVLSQAAPPGARLPSRSRIITALKGKSIAGASMSLFRQPGLVWAAVPIWDEGSRNIVGVVYVETALDAPSPPQLGPGGRDHFPLLLVQTASDFVTGVESRLAVTGVIIGLLAVGLGVWLARSITEPIQQLRRAVGRIASGDLTQRVVVQTRDEVGALAHDINLMAERLEGDVTELRRQEQLRRDLVANVSHDLATPLTGIQGFTEALLDGVVSEESERADLHASIYTEVQRLRRLVGDLQDLSSLENGMGHIQPEALQLDGIVDEAIKVERREAEERGITISVNMPEDLAEVWADGDRITQVLFNLIDNAMRYTPAGGQIIVSAHQHGRWVEVVVRDTGLGIPEEELPYVFERFHRVDRSRSHETGGSGLGLAIVKAIILMH